MNKEDKEVIKNIISQLNKLVEDDDEKEVKENNDEEELLKDLHHINGSLVDKIYRIQSFVYDSYSENNMSINNFVPHMVIGINHDGTEDTMDLMQMVTPNYFKFIADHLNKEGDYFLSNIYEYIVDKHVDGYSEKIRWKMKNIDERYRRPVKNITGDLLSIRTANCKILNPVELFGARSLDVFSTKYSDLNGRYGEIYEAFIKDPKNRLCYGDLECSIPIWHWSNSFAFYSNNNGDARCFDTSRDGSCYHSDNDHTYGIAPVIRLGRR